MGLTMFPAVSVFRRLVRCFTTSSRALEIGSNPLPNASALHFPDLLKKPKIDESKRPFVLPYFKDIGAEKLFGRVEEIECRSFLGTVKPEPMQLNGNQDLWNSLVSKSKYQSTEHYIAIELRAGDYVLVKPGTSKKKRPPVWKEEFKREYDIAKVIFLPTHENEMGHIRPGLPRHAHVQWLAHGGETIMGKMASSRELFLLSCCEHVPFSSILGKVRVDKLHAPGLLDTLHFQPKDHFYYRMHYDPVTHAMEDASVHEEKEHSHKATAKCRCCIAEQDMVNASRIMLDNSKSGIPLLRSKGVTYRKNDIVYIPGDGDNPQLHRIGQLEDVLKVPLRTGNFYYVEAKFRLLERFHNLHDSESREPKDERKLYYTATPPVTLRLADGDLRGKCFVRHVTDIPDLNVFKDQNENHFYLSDPPLDARIASNMASATVSNKAYRKHIVASSPEFAENVRMYQAKGQLRGMSLYTGAGGLDVGLHQSRSIKTKVAVEWDPVAVASFRENFPDVQTFNCSVDELLKSTLENAAGKCSEEFKDKLPSPGDIDIMYAGPPCQDASSANRHKKVDAVNNAQFVVFLSWVIYMQPKYFLLENVHGLLSLKLGTSENGDGIVNGTIRTIYRTAADHGYQIRYTLANSGDYGVPSSRRRVLIWGARIGNQLPKFAQASYVQIKPKQWKQATHKIFKGAPHLAVTIDEAISDLPLFEYELPKSLKLTESRQKQIDDREESVLQYAAEKFPAGGSYIGTSTQEYKSGPRSEFQRKCRDGASDVLTYHISQSWSLQSIERIWHEPFGEQPDRYKFSESGEINKDYTYVRLRQNEQFQTCTTQCRPTSNIKLLLPTQNRQLSIRENLRCQSFPDTYTFSPKCTLPDMQRLIGNSVPPLLGRMLGTELFKVLPDRNADKEKPKLGVLRGNEKIAEWERKERKRLEEGEFERLADGTGTRMWEHRQEILLVRGRKRHGGRRDGYQGSEGW